MHIKLSLIHTGLSEGISERFRPIQSLKYEFKDAQGSIIKDS